MTATLSPRRPLPCLRSSAECAHGRVGGVPQQAGRQARAGGGGCRAHYGHAERPAGGLPWRHGAAVPGRLHQLLQHDGGKPGGHGGERARVGSAQRARQASPAVGRLRRLHAVVRGCCNREVSPPCPVLLSTHFSHDICTLAAPWPSLRRRPHTPAGWWRSAAQRLAAPLLAATNTFLLANGRDTAASLPRLHASLHGLVLPGAARDARLRDPAVTYLRIQLQLGTLQRDVARLQVRACCRAGEAASGQLAAQPAKTELTQTPLTAGQRLLR